MGAYDIRCWMQLGWKNGSGILILLMGIAKEGGAYNMGAYDIRCWVQMGWKNGLVYSNWLQEWPRQGELVIWELMILVLDVDVEWFGFTDIAYGNSLGRENF